MTIDDLFFRPSLDLDRYQYNVFLTYASAKELEEDLLFKNTYWQIVKQFDDDYQEQFNVWFDGSVAVTQPPPEPPKPPPVYEYVYEDDFYCTRHLGFTTY